MAVLAASVLAASALVRTKVTERVKLEDRPAKIWAQIGVCRGARRVGQDALNNSDKFIGELANILQ